METQTYVASASGEAGLPPLPSVPSSHVQSVDEATTVTDPYFIQPFNYHKYAIAYESYRDHSQAISVEATRRYLIENSLSEEQIAHILSLTDPNHAYILDRHRFITAAHLGEVVRHGIAPIPNQSTSIPASLDPSAYQPKERLQDLHLGCFPIVCHHVLQGWKYCNMIADVCLQYAAIEREAGERLVRLCQSGDANLDETSRLVKALSSAAKSDGGVQTRPQLWESWMSIKHYLEAIAQLRIRCATIITDAIKPVASYANETVNKVKGWNGEGTTLIVESQHLFRAVEHSRRRYFSKRNEALECANALFRKKAAAIAAKNATPAPKASKPRAIPSTTTTATRTIQSSSPSGSASKGSTPNIMGTLSQSLPMALSSRSASSGSANQPSVLATSGASRSLSPSTSGALLQMSPVRTPLQPLSGLTVGMGDSPNTQSIQQIRAQSRSPSAMVGSSPSGSTSTSSSMAHSNHHTRPVATNSLFNSLTASIESFLVMGSKSEEDRLGVRLEGIRRELTEHHMRYVNHFLAYRHRASEVNESVTKIMNWMSRTDGELCPTLLGCIAKMNESNRTANQTIGKALDSIRSIIDGFSPPTETRRFLELVAGVESPLDLDQLAFIPPTIAYIPFSGEQFEDAALQREIEMEEKAAQAYITNKQNLPPGQSPNLGCTSHLLTTNSAGLNPSEVTGNAEQLSSTGGQQNAPVGNVGRPPLNTSSGTRFFAFPYSSYPPLVL